MARHECGFCKKEFERLAHLEKHLARKTPCHVDMQREKRHACPECGRAFRFDSALSRHRHTCKGPQIKEDLQSQLTELRAQVQQISGGDEEVAAVLTRGEDADQPGLLELQEADGDMADIDGSDTLSDSTEGAASPQDNAASDTHTESETESLDITASEQENDVDTVGHHEFEVPGPSNDEAQQLSQGITIDTAFFKFGNKKIRKTSDEPQRVSVYDLISAIIGHTNKYAQCVFERLKETYREVSAASRNLSISFLMVPRST